jgi:Prokaryotic E2 family E
MARRDILDRQIAEATGTFPGASICDGGDGTHIVSVPLPLRAGWNAATTVVRFVVPVPYPAAQPDCFYTDPGLRLADGRMPTNSGLQVLAGQQLMWFSWHVASWNPVRDTLLGYTRFIAERLRRAQ